MSRHRYDWRGLRGDYLRAAAGLAVSIAALAVSGMSGFIGWMFGIAGLVFLLFGLRTLLRHLSNYELTETGLTRSYDLQIGRARRTLAWQSLERLSLRFFPAKRDRSQGWMELTLAGGGTRMRLDSTLGGFETVVRAAVAAARAGKIAPSETTRSNLAALGVVWSTGDGGAETVRPDDPARR